jgi:hypothetical protein
MILGMGVLAAVAWPLAAAEMPGMAMEMHGQAGAMAAASPTVSAAVMPAELTPGQAVSLSVVLRDARGRVLAPVDLQMLHGEPVHLLLIDAGLGDYHHLHPLWREGKWWADFVPGKAAYRGWAEIMPVDGPHQFVPFGIGGAVPNPGGLRDEESFYAVADGLRFDLRLAMPLKVGAETLAILHVSRADGGPVDDLQPIMGAYAHLVGFDAGLRGVLHAHPLGAAPAGDAARGGPVLNFHLLPEESGLVRLFLQVRHAGAVVTVPFTVRVGS